jgi:hypothetical protein
VPSWETAVAEDWLGKWAMNQMLINVATRNKPERLNNAFRLAGLRSLRPPGGGLLGSGPSGLSICEPKVSAAGIRSRRLSRPRTDPYPQKRCPCAVGTPRAYPTKRITLYAGRRMAG